MYREAVALFAHRRVISVRRTTAIGAAAKGRRRGKRIENCFSRRSGDTCRRLYRVSLLSRRHCALATGSFPDAGQGDTITAHENVSLAMKTGICRFVTEGLLRAPVKSIRTRKSFSRRLTRFCPRIARPDLIPVVRSNGLWITSTNWENWTKKFAVCVQNCSRYFRLTMTYQEQLTINEIYVQREQGRQVSLRNLEIDNARAS